MDIGRGTPSGIMRELADPKKMLRDVNYFDQIVSTSK